MKIVKPSIEDMAEAVNEVAKKQMEIVEGMAAGIWAPPAAPERRHFEWQARSLEAAAAELRAMANLMAVNSGKRRAAG